MPLSPSGVYTLPVGYLAITGQDILPSQHNPPLEDIANVLSEAFYRTGVTPMLANLNMNTFKMINLAAGTNATDAVNYSQLLGAIISSVGGRTLQFPLDGILIQWNSTALTTDSGGGGLITFQTAFSVAPVVLGLTNGDSDSFGSSVSLNNTTTTNFSFRTHSPSAVSTAFRVNWLAIGAA